MNNLEKFMQKIGVKSDVISKLMSDEEQNVDDFVSSYKSDFKSVVQNDPEFIQPIKDEIRGSELSKIEHKVKKTFGLSSEEVKDKKFDEIIAAAYEKSKSTYAASSDEVQQKMIELARENKRLMEEVIPAKEREAYESIKGYKKETVMKSMLANKKDLLVKPEIAYLTIQDYLTKNFEVDIDDSNKFVLKTKNGLNPLNEDGTKTMSFEDIVEKKLMDEGLIRQSNGDGSNSSGNRKMSTLNKVQDEPKFNLPGLKKAQENVEQMKNLRTFGQ